MITVTYGIATHIGNFKYSLMMDCFITIMNKALNNVITMH